MFCGLALASATLKKSARTDRLNITLFITLPPPLIMGLWLFVTVNISADLRNLKGRESLYFRMLAPFLEFLRKYGVTGDDCIRGRRHHRHRRSDYAKLNLKLTGQVGSGQS